MDIIQINQEIQNKIKLLEKGRALLEEQAITKSQTIAEYEKHLAVTIIQLKNGKEIEFEGETIVNPPATIIEKIARGICYQDKLEMDKAEAMYKATITKIQSIQAELNGYQSIFRHLEKG